MQLPPDKSTSVPPFTVDIAALSWYLSKRGYSATPDQALNAQHLLLELAAQGSPTLQKIESLALLLAPIYCTNREQQSTFAADLEAFLRPKTPSAGNSVPSLPQALQIAFWHKATATLRGLAPTLIACLTLLGMIITIRGPSRLAIPPVVPPVVDQTAPSDDRPNPPPLATAVPTGNVVSVQPIAEFRERRSEPLIPLWLILSAPPLAVMGLLLRRHSAVIRRVRSTPEHLKTVHLAAPGSTLLPGLHLQESARRLRDLQWVDSPELDLDRTLAATINNGGCLTPYYGTKAEPQYLVLVDRYSAVDLQSQLADEIIQQFHEVRVATELFDYTRHPAFCTTRPTDRIRGVEVFSLEQMLDRYPEHRVLLFGDGKSFLDRLLQPHTGWIRKLADRGAILVTPTPSEEWSTLEQTLTREGLCVLPLSKAGFGQLDRSFRGGQRSGSPSASWQRHSIVRDLEVRLLERVPPAPEIIRQVCQELQDDLGTEGFQWLAACAVYPEIHWGITVRLGLALAGSQSRFEELLPQLARLTWFRQGFMPDWFRQAVLAQLSPTQDRLVRDHVVALFATVGEPDTRHTFPLHIGVRHEADWLKRLWNWWQGPQSFLAAIRGAVSDKKRTPLKDQVFLDFLSGRNPLSQLAPSALRKLLFPRGAGFLGLRSSVLVLLGALLTWGTWGLANRDGYVGHAATNVVVSDNGETVWSLSPSGGMLWNTALATPEMELTEKDRVTCAEWSPDGTRFATGGFDGIVRIRNGLTGELEAEISQVSTLHSLSWSPDGSRIAMGDFISTVYIADVRTKQILEKIDGYDARYGVSGISWSPDGHQVIAVSGELDNDALIWNVDSGQLINLVGHTDAVNAVAWLPQGNTVITASSDGTIRFWNPATGQLEQTIESKQHTFSSISVSSDGSQFVTGSFDGELSVWSTSKGELLWERRGNSGRIIAVDWSPDGASILAGTEIGTLLLCDARSGVRTFASSGSEQYIDSVAWSPDGQKILFSQGEIAKIWSLHKPEAIAPALAAGDQLVSISGNGAKILTTNVNGTVKVWERFQSKPVSFLNQPGLAGGVFDDNGRFACTWDAQGTVMVHPLEQLTLSAVRRLRADPQGNNGHSGPLLGARFLPREDGTPELLTWSVDGTARLWDIASGAQLQVMRHGPSVSQAVLRQDGQMLALLSNEGRLSVWQTGPDMVSKENQKGAKSEKAELSQVYFQPPPSEAIALEQKSNGVEPLFQMNNVNAPVRGVAFAADSDFMTYWTERSQFVSNTDVRYSLPQIQLPTVIETAGLHFSGKATFALTQEPSPRLLFYHLVEPESSDSKLGVIQSAPVPAESYTTKPVANPDDWIQLHVETDIAEAIPHPDGQTVISRSTNGEVRLWDIRSGLPLGDSIPTPAPVKLARLSRDGSTLVLACEDGTILPNRIQTTGQGQLFLLSQPSRSPDFHFLQRSLDTKFGFRVAVTSSTEPDEIFDEWTAQCGPDDPALLVLFGTGNTLDGEYQFLSTTDVSTHAVTATQLRQAIERLKSRQVLLIVDAPLEQQLDLPRQLDLGPVQDKVCLLLMRKPTERSVLGAVTQAIEEATGPISARELARLIPESVLHSLTADDQQDFYFPRPSLSPTSSEPAPGPAPAPNELPFEPADKK